MKLSAFVSLAVASVALASPAPPTIPENISGKDGVKTYLLEVATACDKVAADLKRDADAYAMLVSKHGDAEKAALADAKETSRLILALRDDYRRLDSFGYEYIEGIVAGVPSLAQYDVELDAGVPTEGAAPDDDIAPVVVKTSKLTLDRAGSLNNFLIEPTVFGTNEKFTNGKATLADVSNAPVNLPNAELIVALADYAVDGYARFSVDAQKWMPEDKDCFEALVAMTPTLGDYFEEWKESRMTGQAAGGRFVAVSRVSDMRGIMASTQLIWKGLEGDASAQDKALAEQITRGYESVLAFVDDVESRDQSGKLTVEQIDTLGTQARETTDKLATQVTEAAALMKIEVGSTN